MIMKYYILRDYFRIYYVLLHEVINILTAMSNLFIILFLRGERMFERDFKGSASGIHSCSLNVTRDPHIKTPYNCYSIKIQENNIF